MSTTNVDTVGVEVSDVTPVTIDASALSSTAPGYLRDLKYELARANRVPAGLTVRATFSETDSLTVQTEVERVREYVRAASFLGVGHLRLELTAGADDERIAQALRACEERARREGVRLDVVRVT